MAKHEGYFFWGAVLGAVTAAIAGCVMLAKSFRSSPAGSDFPKVLPRSKRKSQPNSGKTGTVRRVRRVSAKK